jgi:hypothetical protein
MARLSRTISRSTVVAGMLLAFLAVLWTASCSCQETSLGGDTDGGTPDFQWGDSEGMPDFDSILQTPENEEMPEFVMDVITHDLFSEDSPPEPWVPDFWDVDFDYLDVGPDYLPDPVGCGNDVLDPGEECDDGNDDDNDACTSLCLLPRCGDGTAWYGMEDCDPPGTVRPCMTDCGSAGQEWCLPYCRWEGICTPPVETCGNGVDDDCDGIVDGVFRLCPNVPVTDGPIGSRRSKLAWSSSEFLVMWGSPDGSTVLSRLDPWGRKVAWDWIVNSYFQGLFHLAWTGSGMGTFLGIPGYDLDESRGPATAFLFFQALYPDGTPLSGFVGVADSESTSHNLGVVFVASSENGHGVLFHRNVEDEHDHMLNTEYTFFLTLSPDGADISGETILGSYNAANGGTSYWGCFVATAGGYAALKHLITEDTYELEQIAPDGSVIGSQTLALTPDEHELPILSCVPVGSDVALILYYNNEYRIHVSFWGLDGVFSGSQDVFINFEVEHDENDDAGALIAAAGAESELGLFWTDTRDGNQELYFSRIGSGGEILAGPARLTRTPADSRLASPIWDGEAYAVTWWDSDGTDEDIYFTRFSPCP